MTLWGSGSHYSIETRQQFHLFGTPCTDGRSSYKKRVMSWYGLTSYLVGPVTEVEFFDLSSFIKEAIHMVGLGLL